MRTAPIAVAALMIGLSLSGPAPAASETPAKPPEVSTAGPAVALSAAQRAAIAAKGIPVALPVPAPTYSKPAAAPTRMRLPQVSPAIGIIPRPEWSNPSLTKKGDVVVSGSRTIVLPHPPGRGEP